MKWRGLASFPHYKLRWNLPFSPRLLNGKIDLSDSVTFFMGKKASHRWPRNDKKERKRNSTRSSQAAKKTNLTHSYIFVLFCFFVLRLLCLFLSSIFYWEMKHPTIFVLRHTKKPLHLSQAFGSPCLASKWRRHGVHAVAESETRKVNRYDWVGGARFMTSRVELPYVAPVKPRPL